MKLELRQKIVVELLISLALTGLYAFLLDNMNYLKYTLLFNEAELPLPKTILSCIEVLVIFLCIDIARRVDNLNLELRQKVVIELCSVLVLTALYTFLFKDANLKIYESPFSGVAKIFPKTILLSIMVLITILCIDTIRILCSLKCFNVKRISLKLELRQKIIIELFIGFALAGLYAFLLINADQLIHESPFGGMDVRIFPKTILLCIVILCTILCIDTIRMLINLKNNNITMEMHLLVEDDEEHPLSRILAYLGIMVAYSFGFYYFGFINATPVAMILVALLLGMKHSLLGGLGVILFTLALDYASFNFLQIMLPTGAFFE